MTESTLLGYLARFASFTMQAEVLCTQGLAYLLQKHEEAHAALVHEVEKCTGITINQALRWIPEPVLSDRSRPDLEAQTDGDVPIVDIEAKLWAGLIPAQLESYVTHLLKNNKGESALIVLVPQTRKSEAARVIRDTFSFSGSMPWRIQVRCGIAVICWEEIFNVLRSGKYERLDFEIEQLQDMYRELSGDFIVPLASDDVREWKSSETDFAKLVDQVTRQLTRHHRLYPLGTESLENASPDSEPVEYYRRYVCGCNDYTASCYSIGARDPFTDHETFVWMRFHKDTGNFELIRRRIESSDLVSLMSSGHIWIPLDVPRDVAGENMIRALVAQAENVARIAYQTV